MLLKCRSEIGFCSSEARVESLKGEFLSLWKCPGIQKPLLNAIFEHFSNPANTVRPAAELTRFGMPRSEICFDPGTQFVERQRAIAAQLEQMAQRLGLAVTNRRNYMLAHHMCTARMSSDPADGVIDANLKVHSMRNLYVCGGASFSSVGAANPTIAVAALAHRLGSYLAGGAANE